MKGQKHLTHVDQLRIKKNRSSPMHKAKAVCNAIDQKFFAGPIAWTIGETKNGFEVHVLTNKSHDNAARGIQEAAKARFGIDTVIVDGKSDGYSTVIQFPKETFTN